jgi:hypothetical protein
MLFLLQAIVVAGIEDSYPLTNTIQLNKSLTLHSRNQGFVEIKQQESIGKDKNITE